MQFDRIIDRRGTHSQKWDMMEKIYGVSPDDGLAMWVADSDFPAPDCIQDAVKALHGTGVYGYFGDDADFHEAIRWWMDTRHGWQIEPAWISTTHGLVNAVSMCLDAFTAPGDGVVIFSPVYHSFARVINASGRQLVEHEMTLTDGRYTLDLEACDATMTGAEKMLIFCSPHNPGGRVWSRAELQAVIDFASRHDLILVSDEIHHDIVYPGATHIPTATVDSGVRDRLVTLTAPSKTFGMPGAQSGQVIIEDADLRARLAARMAAFGVSPNLFGATMTTAAYSEDGARWVDDLVGYLDGNRRLIDARIDAIPGLKSMPLESTFLSWVDFSGTGMTRAEFTGRVEKDARIAANHGPTFGKGGEMFLRFNFATPRARVKEAMDRMQEAFSDLQ